MCICDKQLLSEIKRFFGFKLMTVWVELVERKQVNKSLGMTGLENNRQIIP